MAEQEKHKKARQSKSKGPVSRRKKRRGMCLEDRPCLEANAAGIDVGAREMYVAVPPDRDQHPSAPPRQARRGGGRRLAVLRSRIFISGATIPSTAANSPQPRLVPQRAPTPSRLE